VQQHNQSKVLLHISLTAIGMQQVAQGVYGRQATGLCL
jgi:hypothetical protein